MRSPSTTRWPPTKTTAASTTSASKVLVWRRAHWPSPQQWVPDYSPPPTHTHTHTYNTSFESPKTMSIGICRTVVTERESVKAHPVAKEIIMGWMISCSVCPFVTKGSSTNQTHNKPSFPIHDHQQYKFRKWIFYPTVIMLHVLFCLYFRTKIMIQTLC